MKVKEIGRNRLIFQLSSRHRTWKIGVGYLFGVATTHSKLEGTETKPGPAPRLSVGSDFEQAVRTSGEP